MQYTWGYDTLKKNFDQNCQRLEGAKSPSSGYSTLLGFRESGDECLRCVKAVTFQTKRVYKEKDEIPNVWDIFT